MVFEMRRVHKYHQTKRLQSNVDDVVTRKCSEHAQQEGGFKRKSSR